MPVVKFHQNTDSLSSKQSRRAHLVARKIEEMQEFISNNSGSFGQEVMALTRKRGYNKATFCEKTLLSEKTYDRIVRNEIRGLPRPETVMQICVGLNLGIEYGEPLFERAGYKLEGSEILLAYRIILLTCENIDIFECNEILHLLGLPMLAKRVMKKLV